MLRSEKRLNLIWPSALSQSEGFCRSSALLYQNTLSLFFHHVFVLFFWANVTMQRKLSADMKQKLSALCYCDHVTFTKMLSFVLKHCLVLKKVFLQKACSLNPASSAQTCSLTLSCSVSVYSSPLFPVSIQTLLCVFPGISCEIFDDTDFCFPSVHAEFREAVNHWRRVSRAL